ncbi:MAG: oligosaccharide flippase family protein, partial [Myxococcales bacterium]
MTRPPPPPPSSGTVPSSPQAVATSPANAGGGVATVPPDRVDRAVEAGKGALFIGAAKVFFMLSGFVQQVLLARLVNVAGVGAFGAVNSAISMVNNTVVQATIQGVSKFTAEDDSRTEAVKRTALGIQTLAGIIIALAFFLGAPLIAEFEKAPSYVPYYRIAAAIPLLYAVYAVFVGSVNGQRRFRAQAGFDMTFSSAKTVLLLGGAAVAGIAGAFAGFALAALVIVVVAARVVGLPRLRTAGAAVFPAARLGAFMLTIGGYNLLLNVELLYDQPLLHHFAGLVDPARGGVIAGHYQALRTLALLPYQALLVVTFVIFPLISRSTFAADREATRAYVTQTLRVALILATAMGVALGARPAALIAILFRPEYQEGARALPILVVGECCLALLAVTCAILNAAGRPLAALCLMATTVLSGLGAAYVMVPGAALGSDMLVAMALAAAGGMVLGFVLATTYVRVRLGGSVPARTIVRVVLAAAAAVMVGRVLPGHGRVVGLAITVLVAVVYFAMLVVLREFGPTDRAKFRKILKRH